MPSFRWSWGCWFGLLLVSFLFPLWCEWSAKRRAECKAPTTPTLIQVVFPAWESSKREAAWGAGRSRSPGPHQCGWCWCTRRKPKDEHLRIYFSPLMWSYFWTEHKSYLGAGQLPGERTDILPNMSPCLPLNYSPSPFPVIRQNSGGLASVLTFRTSQQLVPLTNFRSISLPLPFEDANNEQCQYFSVSGWWTCHIVSEEMAGTYTLC